MSPPNTPGVPGTRLPPPPARPAREQGRPRQQSHHDTRAEPTNPPPAELAPDGEDVEFDRPSRLEQDEFRQAVHASYGKAHFKGPAWVFGIVALIALCVGATYYLDHREVGANDCASKADFNAVDKHVSELAASIQTLTTTVNRNADQAHNDAHDVAIELHSYINAHAR